MRTIGLFTGWACKDWVNLAIQNHLRIVDELHVMIAAHNARFQEIDDGSLAIAKEKWKFNKIVTFYEPTIQITASCDRTKCALLNQMLLAAAPEPGDIVMICDSDEFYDDAAIKEIQDKFDGFKWDSLLLEAMYFVINMQWYLKQDGLQRLFRVRPVEGWRKDKFYFKPTQKPIPRAVDKQVLLRSNPMFHYSLLSPIKYKKIHWSTENGADPTKMPWLEEIYAKWNPEDHKLCNELVARNPTRGDYFYVNNDMGSPKVAPYMYRYDGVHPRCIESSGLKNIKDFR